MTVVVDFLMSADFALQSMTVEGRAKLMEAYLKEAFETGYKCGRKQIPPDYGWELFSNKPLE